MNNTLDTLHHIAIEVKDIATAIAWYTQHLHCTVSYQDDSWGLLKFANISVAFVLPGSHPPHIGISTEHPEHYGTPKDHRDGTASVYIPDPFGNWVEMIKLASSERGQVK